MFSEHAHSNQNNAQHLLKNNNNDCQPRCGQIVCGIYFVTSTPLLTGPAAKTHQTHTHTEIVNESLAFRVHLADHETNMHVSLCCWLLWLCLYDRKITRRHSNGFLNEGGRTARVCAAHGGWHNFRFYAHFFIFFFHLNGCENLFGIALFAKWWGRFGPFCIQL